MEIIVGVIALTFVVAVIFLILTLQDLRKTTKKTDRFLTDMHKTLEVISESGSHLINNANKLTLDIKKKSESLDILFRPLHLINKDKSEEKNTYEKASGIMECIAESVLLFVKIKDEIKEYVKSK
jgi:preprotein translocase subunit YajC